MDRTICSDCGVWCDCDAAGDPWNHTCVPAEPPKPEACFFCRFYTDSGMRAYGNSDGTCRRFPKYEQRNEQHWCGNISAGQTPQKLSLPFPRRSGKG